MGRTILLEEIVDRNATELLREVARRQEPLTVIFGSRCQCHARGGASGRA